MRSILSHCPYLTDEEVERCWKQAKALAAQKQAKGVAYWGVVSKIARKLADNLDTERRKLDDEDWQKQQASKAGGI